MAVPKKKRYKQIVRLRRSLIETNNLRKKNVTITKFKNYANILNEYKNISYCSFCKSLDNTKNNKLCSSCYVIYFLNYFAPKNEIANKKFRTRDIGQEQIQELFYELSKTFFPSGRP